MFAFFSFGGPPEFAPRLVEPNPLLLWDALVETRAGFGYDDNPTLAHQFREGSGFSNLGLDLIVLRAPVDGREFRFFFSGDDRRYWNAPDSPISATYLSRGEWSITTEPWTLRLSLQHFFVDEVVDLSDQTVGFGVARAQGHSLSIFPSLRYELNSGWRIEVLTTLEREWFAAPLDGYRAVTPGLDLSREWAPGSSLGLNFAGIWRAYDATPYLTATGDPDGNSTATLVTRRASLAWRQRWEPANRWSTTLQASFERLEDGHSGYYNFGRTVLSGQISWKPTEWLIRLSWRYARQTYPVQPSLNSSDPLRHHQEFSSGLRIERHFGKRWQVWADVHFQRSFSNVVFDAYHQNFMETGIGREF